MCATSQDLLLAVGKGALAIALLGLCGYALSRLTWGEIHDTGSRLAASVGVGTSAVACSWLLTTIHPALLWATLLLLVLSSSGVLVWNLFEARRTRSAAALGPVLASTLGLLAWRLYQVRDLAFPAWVDSVHHAVVVRKMLQTWRLPRDLSPYLQMPFFYHFAFHGVTSLFAALARLSLPESMIVMGQALQVAAGLSVYCVARVLWQQRLWAAVAAALACFVAQMPAFYTAWGKYPLLTAMVLLPLAMSVTILMVRDSGPPRRMAALAVLVAGTILAHSFAALLLILFIGLAVAQAVVSRLARRRTPTLRSGWLFAAGGAALGILLTWPWIHRVWQHAGRFVRLKAGREVMVPSTTYFSGYLEYLWALTGPNRNRLLFALAFPGVGLAIRRAALRPVALWLIALLPLVSPWGLRVSPFSPDRVLIVLFLPACLLATEVLRTAAARLARWHVLGTDPRHAAGAVVVAIAAWAFAGGLETRNLVPRSAILASDADAKAMAWIESHVSPDARFFIELAPWPPYGYRGVDGAWWLLPITGRHALLPPALYGLGDSHQVERVNQMAEKASAVAGCGPQFWDLVLHERLTHVYFNTRRAFLRPRAFDGCPSIRRIYASDGVYIYQLLWPPPE